MFEFCASEPAEPQNHVRNMQVGSQFNQRGSQKDSFGFSQRFHGFQCFGIYDPFCNSVFLSRNRKGSIYKYGCNKSITISIAVLYFSDSIHFLLHHCSSTSHTDFSYITDYVLQQSQGRTYAHEYILDQKQWMSMVLKAKPAHFGCVHTSLKSVDSPAPPLGAAPLAPSPLRRPGWGPAGPWTEPPQTARSFWLTQMSKSSLHTCGPHI